MLILDRSQSLVLLRFSEARRRLLMRRPPQPASGHLAGRPLTLGRAAQERRRLPPPAGCRRACRHRVESLIRL